MPRIARKNIQENFIHIVTEGIKKEYIFYQNKYKNEYIKLLKKYVSEMNNIQLISYCVMSNHAHILIYMVSIEEVSKLMRKLNTAYAIYYNKNEERVGFVFANRYYSQTIKNERHLWECIQYIHKNPVKAGIVDKPERYSFSSFKEFVESRFEEKVAKLIIRTEENLEKIEFEYIVNDEFEFLDILEESEKQSRIEDLINHFCEEYKVKLSQIKKSNYLIIKFKEYLNRNFKLTNKTICGILGIGKNRIKQIEKYFE